VKVVSLVSSLLLGGVPGVSGQGFVNLDFEQAIVVVNNPTYGWLDWSLAAPGWSHSSGSTTMIIYYGQEHIGTDQIYLLEDSASPVWAPGTQLEGAYSLAFASGYDTGPGLPYPWVTAFISQTGSVPASVHSVQMLATGPFRVFLDGVEISMFSLGGNRYGGDISNFAGTTAELKIVNVAPVGQVHNYTVADAIMFSPTSVLEVNTLADGGPGSLRDAIGLAQNGDRIIFTVAGRILLTNGSLVLDKDLTVTGPGPAELAVSGNSSSRVFVINSNITAEISGLTICDGKASDGVGGGEGMAGEPGAPGGGVYSAGTLTLRNCVITGNSAGEGGLGGHTRGGGPGGPGGGIWNIATLTLSSCVVSNNSAGGGGQGAVTLVDETGQPGGSGGDGGGIWNAGGLTVSQCVLSSNSCGSGGDGSAGYSYDYPANGSGTQGGAGGSGGNGGGIYSTGRLALTGCRIEGNLAGNGGGGGLGGHGGHTGAGGRGAEGGAGGSGGSLYNAGVLALELSTLHGNTGGTGGYGGNGGSVGLHGDGPGPGGFGGNGGAGGAVFNVSTATLARCTLSLNRAGSGGLGGDRGMPEGGMGNTAYPGLGGNGGAMATSGNAALTNCTLSGNLGGNGMGAGNGGGIQNGLALTLRSCTVVSNATGGPMPVQAAYYGPSDGGGIAGGAQIVNTIIALNSDYQGWEDPNNYPDIAGTISSLGHNLIGIADGGTGFAGTDLTGSLAAPLDPRVGPLADNGGPTWTHVLLTGSPAVDAGDNTNAPASDQRGFPRVACGLIDIGAFEAQFCQPRIRSIQVAEGGICWLQFNGLADATYTLLGSTNLVYWTNVAKLPAGPTGLFEFWDGSPTNHPQRFYRLCWP
jgi:hypothetical protein